MRQPAAAPLRAFLIALSLSTVAAAAWWLDPEKIEWLPACPFHTLTRLYCPGCGTLRCLHQLAHGRLTEALTLNAIVVAASPLLAWVTVCEIAEALGRRVPAPDTARFAWMLPVALVMFGVARNLPIYPLSLLAP